MAILQQDTAWLGVQTTLRSEFLSSKKYTPLTLSICILAGYRTQAIWMTHKQLSVGGGIGVGLAWRFPLCSLRNLHKKNRLPILTEAVMNYSCVITILFLLPARAIQFYFCLCDILYFTDCIHCVTIYIIGKLKYPLSISHTSNHSPTLWELPH